MKLLFVAAFLFSGFSQPAQDDKSKAILQELSTKAKGFTSIDATFQKSFEKGKIREQASGSVAVKGKKYFADTGEGQIIYCDGRTVWTHMPDSKEAIKCSYEEVQKEMPIEPSQMFTIWEKDFKYRYVSEETINGVAHDVIDLYPIKPQDKQFHTITLKVNRQKKEVYQMIIKGKDSSVTTFTIKTFITNSELPDTKFNFTPSKYPGLTVIDC